MIKAESKAANQAKRPEINAGDAHQMEDETGVVISHENNATHYLRTHCRACGGTHLDAFLHLGNQPLANSFPKDSAEFAGEPLYPLDVYRCSDCSLIQLLDVIAPEVLFRNYIYVTGTSRTMAKHNQGYAQAVVTELGIGPDDLVVEVASNDGSLLSCFKEHGVRTLGIEPARNIAEMARARGIETVAEFFGLELARKVRTDYGVARAVVANNVLAHVDNTRDFLAGCRELIDDKGRIVTEFPYLGELLERTEYDTVYHEHLCYFSVIALMRLYEAVGLVIQRIDRVPVHGGSLRVFAARKSGSLQDHSAAVLDMAEEERRKGYHTAEPYIRLAQAVAANRESLLGLLEALKQDNKIIAGYGAPAKGNTLLNYCGIDTRLVDYIVDQNPLKVGLYTPGTHIPVKPPSTLENQRPDYLLILAWNFAEEIMQQQAEFAARGGKFILPIPQPRVVGL